MKDDLKTIIQAYFQERNHTQERLEQEKRALQLELWSLKNQQILEAQKQRQQTATIKLQQAELNQLEKELQNKETEILRLNEELNTQINDWAQKGIAMKELEAKIEGMDAANEKNTQKNQLLEHEINKMKEELRKEKAEHLQNKIKLEMKKKELEAKTREYDNAKKRLDNITGTVTGATENLVDSVTGFTNRMWNGVKNWFS
ncbi:MAG: chromosome segregation ATPase [Candidatus Phytoplasma cynodontis]|nr:MAG: chromosome segregation ATPase [Candidatus Phytoplasma cynodontis]